MQYIKFYVLKRSNNNYNVHFSSKIWNIFQANFFVQKKNCFPKKREYYNYNFDL